ncbi:involved in mRNA turnover and stability [Olea europaea subsp. europaea]|uniref:Involved in mRNA turnover and stability n=1 Tax=Olea europaea subsp. europaea TaxID=158383 RepID=A0A8S0T4P5_OLEEU|nr:involved in mRNA turnover and stability [Olea europaea subsp. europaea]
MVDEFMVCVDRIIASAACFERSSSESDRETSINDNAAENVNAISEMVSLKKGNSFNGKDIGEGSSTKESMRECRICQEEDDEKDMEAPCACNGTLKFAHRKCIQRWCNKKGGITCEICYQVFSPNYTIPPPRSNVDVMTIDIRQAWAQRIGLRDPHFFTFTTADHQFLQSDYEEYTVANSRTLACFRSVVIILMLILLIRQTLLVTRDFGMVHASSGFFHVSPIFIFLCVFEKSVCICNHLLEFLLDPVCHFGGVKKQIHMQHFFLPMWKFNFFFENFSIRYLFFSWPESLSLAMWWSDRGTLYNAAGGDRGEIKGIESKLSLV